MKRIYRTGISLFILFTIFLGSKTASAQTGTVEPDKRYFPETGHMLTGDFFFFYRNTPDAELVYGFPITEPFEDQYSGRLVQYFERARFEKGNGERQLDVFASPLGYYLYEASTELYSPRSLPGCHFYAEYKKYVCYAFLDFFEAHGGVAQFGYPISNFEIRDSWIVQYFQRARFEWHPELPSGEKVQLSDLGRQYFETIGENPRLLRPHEAPGGAPIPNPVIELQVRASVKNAATHQNGEQTINIIVQDQRRIAVPDADFTLEITLPSGETLVPVTQMATDKNGIANYSFTFKNQPIGVATIKVQVKYNDLYEETVTSFRIWW